MWLTNMAKILLNFMKSPIDAIGSISPCHGESCRFESDIGL